MDGREIVSARFLVRSVLMWEAVMVRTVSRSPWSQVESEPSLAANKSRAGWARGERDVVSRFGCKAAQVERGQLQQNGELHQPCGPGRATSDTKVALGPLPLPLR